MEVYRKQLSRGGVRFLVLTDDDPKTRLMRGLMVDVQAGAVRRVRSVPALLRAEPWRPLAAGDPSLEELVRRVPALRPHRGIEVRLPGGETAWVRWGQWSSGSRAAQARLSEATRAVTVPAYEPDGDHFLALRAVAALGGEVLDPPRAAAPAGDAY